MLSRLDDVLVSLGAVLATTLQQTQTWTNSLKLGSLLPEDALGLSSAQGQHVLGELDLHPGQLPVWEELALPLHHLLQRAAEQGGRDDGPPAVVDLLQGGLPEALGGGWWG